MNLKSLSLLAVPHPLSIVYWRIEGIAKELDPVAGHLYGFNP